MHTSYSFFIHVMSIHILVNVMTLLSLAMLSEFHIYVANRSCSISFGTTLATSFLLALDMAKSRDFVDKLCWRLKQLGAPKVHDLLGIS